MKLSGPEAFAALQEAVLAPDHLGKVPNRLAEPPFERLRQAILDSGASACDLTVLLRQALIYETSRRGGGLAAHMTMGPDWRDVQWSDFSLRAIVGPLNQPLIGAQKWMPLWLLRAEDGVDALAAAEIERRFGHAEVAGDPFLTLFGFNSYRSRGQRAAARAALTTPAGSTLAVTLATGDGKSLLFRLIDRVGFAGDLQEPGRGVTLVIVPTVALALDHSINLGDGIPRAWQSGDLGTNAAIAAAVADGTQGLCFVSPEAACGPLRRSLLSAARAGAIRALVIDEAHLVDAWGTGFRTEFQALSGLHAELSSASPANRQPRTICLSATLGAAALDTLETLFPGQEFHSLCAASLRPEPDYWFAHPSDDAERAARVLEALRHLPRPAILYVTRVRDAKAWGSRLRDEGYRRLAVVHGETSTSDRERTLRAWSTGEIDLVVATSAFGLGINYAHVRSIVHACVPETLDRYYQEVGRAGRDGRSCISLLVPSTSDFATAREINQTVVIGLKRGLERWRSMFNGPKRHLGGDRFAVRIDMAPGLSARDIDMTGETSTDWNARTLTLMARAGLIRLLGQPEDDSGEQLQGRWESLEILEHDHLSSEVWRTRVGPIRQRIAENNDTSLSLMHDLIQSAAVCPATLFSRVYEGTARVCSSCAVCRNGGERLFPGRPEVEPISPWRLKGVDQRVLSALDHANRLVVLLDEGILEDRRLVQTLFRLAKGGIHNVILFGQQDSMVEKAIANLSEMPVFIARASIPGVTTLPVGPEAVFVGRGERLREVNVTARPTGQERILFAHRDVRSPSRPELPLAQCYDGRILSLSDFYNRIAL